MEDYASILTHHDHKDGGKEICVGKRPGMLWLWGVDFLITYGLWLGNEVGDDMG
jgi:hypothetical protein